MPDDSLPKHDLPRGSESTSISVGGQSKFHFIVYQLDLQHLHIVPYRIWALIPSLAPGLVNDRGSLLKTNCFENPTSLGLLSTTLEAY